jgi:hypothetical protein
MAVTIATVIKNVCLSRHWKAELVIFRTSIQTPASFTHHVAQKPDQTPVYQSVQNLPRTGTWIQNAIATKLYVKTGRMSNQKKAEFVDDIFHIWSFWRGHGEISPNTNSATGRVSDCHNSQIANHLEPFNGSSESWESDLPKWYSGLSEFRPIRDWKLKIHFATVLFRNRFLYLLFKLLIWS